MAASARSSSAAAPFSPRPGPPARPDARGGRGGPAVLFRAGRRINGAVRRVTRVFAELTYEETAHVVKLARRSHGLARPPMATELLNRGLREEALSTLLGHASTETTRTAYARLSIQTLKDEVERASLSPPR